jgi:acetyl esterase
MSRGTPEEGRAGFRRLAMASAAFAPQVEIASVEDLEVDGAVGPLPARLYRPPRDSLTSRPGGTSSEGTGREAEDPLGVISVPTLVFFHGGGFVIGDIESYDSQCRLLCRDGGVAVLSVEYRLAPEDPFPAAPEDAVAATRWALENADRLGGDPGRVAVGGDSAGGNLAANASLALRDHEPAPAAQLLIYPVTDFDSERPSHAENGEGLFLTLDDMEWFRSLYVGDADVRDPRVSPLLAEDLSGLPPAIVITAEFDPLRDDGEAYAEALEAAGVPVVRRRFDSLIHGFFAMGTASSAASDAIEEVCAELRKALNQPIRA